MPKYRTRVAAKQAFMEAPDFTVFQPVHFEQLARRGRGGGWPSKRSATTSGCARCPIRSRFQGASTSGSTRCAPSTRRRRFGWADDQDAD